MIKPDATTVADALDAPAADDLPWGGSWRQTTKGRRTSPRLFCAAASFNMGEIGMSILRCAGIALTLSLMAVSSANAQQTASQKSSAGQSSKDVVATDLAGNILLTSCNSCGEVDGACADESCCADMACGDICGEGCGGGGLGLGLLGCQPGQIFVGGEWLYVRTTHSENVSYLEQDPTDIQSPQITYQQFDPSYASSYRAYAGYRLCCCGDEIRFTYTRISTDDTDQSPVASSTRNFIAPPEVLAITPGSRLNNRTSTDINNYDLGISKTIPLGSPLGCCDPCNCCPCPAWDLVWTGAVRFANVDTESNYANDLTGTNLAGQERSSTLRTTFDGVGLRTGLLGRRYLGRQGVASVYVKGDISLLVGEKDQEMVDFSNGTPSQVRRHSMSGTNVIPVTELEAGASVCLTRNTMLSAGYFLSAWHDLGIGAEYNYGAGTVTQLNGWDDANILSFDGLFVRAEMGF